MLQAFEKLGANAALILVNLVDRVNKLLLQMRREPDGTADRGCAHGR